MSLKMSKKLYLFFAIVGVFSTQAQIRYSWYTSAEESFIIGDQISSINPVVISNAANNSGLRIGAYAELFRGISAEASLGVIGSARLGSFSTKMVPVEFTGHYNFYTMGKSAAWPLRWHGSLGGGMSLVRAQSPSYNSSGGNSLSTFSTLGASLDLFETEQATLAIGYRHTFFQRDNIDALIQEGGIDQLSRWYTSFRVRFDKNNKSIVSSMIAKNEQIFTLQEANKALKSKVDSLSKASPILNADKSQRMDETVSDISNLEGISKNRFEEMHELQSQNANAVKNVPSQNSKLTNVSNSRNSPYTNDSNPEPQISADPPQTMGSPFVMPAVENTSNETNNKTGYAIVLKTFDSPEDATQYLNKLPKGLGKPFIWEILPLKKYRVVLGVYYSSYERQYKMEELRYYGYSPWITIWRE